MADPAPQAPAAPSRLRWVRAAVTVCVVALAVLLLAPMLGSSDHPVGPGSVSIGFWPTARATPLWAFRRWDRRAPPPTGVRWRCAWSCVPLTCPS
ncbi:MAG: hypothetical protein IPG03_07405 [Candidatus Microthrix sp.]|nr:hypothetical protein [Candidatus Microthrix sp.]MBK6502190.1 hypothetical protein [Candidatus Microthrix sp.]